MTALGLVLLVIGLACGLVIVVDAFRSSVGQGVLALLVPFYVVYYAFARFDRPRRALVIAIWLTGVIVGGALVQISELSAMSHAPESVPGAR